VGLALYMDHNVLRAITLELAHRGVDLLTAFQNPQLTMSYFGDLGNDADRPR
jgi:hypothetical protein